MVNNMRLIRFSTAGPILWGQQVSATEARPVLGDVYGPLHLSASTLPIGALLPPADPPNVFAIGRNYRAHAEETGSAVPDAPLIFMKPSTSLLAAGDEIMLPVGAPNEVDFEAELAIVIGRRARRVSEHDALEYVLGFTCANDVSARDCQRHDKQWSRAKGFDTFCPLGPALVTPDELDVSDLGIRSRLNGKPMQQSSTRHMLHSPAQLISYLSHQFTLLPGTLILTGTPEGVGMARTPPVFLREGDHIEVEIDGLGVLGNPVSAESAETA